MKIRMEKNYPAHVSPYSKINIKSIKNLHRNQSIEVFNYKTWRDYQNHKKMSQAFTKSKVNKNASSMRTLLGDMTNLRKYMTSTQRKYTKENQEKNGQNYTKDLLIKSIDCQEYQNQPICEIKLDYNHSREKILYHKATTVDKLKDFLSRKCPKVKIWKTQPTSIALDYYMSLENKDISFLNGQSLTLQPYKTEPQQQITINSFDILHCIGTGGFSKVFLCRFKEDGKFYAMKVIDKDFIVKNKKKRIVMNEKKIMEQLKHPFIIQMKFSFQSRKSLIFVLELCPGGQLFGLVKKFRIMNQNIARFYMVQILLGLQEIHKNTIVYRDFKPENILIDIEGHIRIADFGLAKPGIASTKDKAYSFCGSPEYMPPQMILKKGHSLQVDFYCLGALLYELVTGLPPFYSQNPDQIYQGTISKPLTFPSHAKISQELRQLLRSLLCKEQSRRLGTYSGVKEVLAHPWFRKTNRQMYLQKQTESPVRFTGIKDLKLIFQEMQVENQEFICDILSQQKNQLRKSWDPVMEKFYYDYRENQGTTSRQSHRKQKENSRSFLSLNSHRYSSNGKVYKPSTSNNKSLKNILTHRSSTGNMTVRKKPLTTRCLDINLYLR